MNEEYSQLNPLLNNDYAIYETLDNDVLFNKLIKCNLKDWDCPICYIEIKKNTVCFPFDCDHMYCFNCIKKQCIATRELHGRIINNIRCPLCRSCADNDWKNYDRLNMKSLYYKDSEINIYDICKI